MRSISCGLRTPKVVLLSVACDIFQMCTPECTSVLLLSVRSGKDYIYAAQGHWTCSALHSLLMGGSHQSES